MVSKRKELLKKLKEGQNPPLVWLYCSDSRVDYNIFGFEPGVAFTIENAGNVFGLGDESKATMAYALTHFAVGGRLSIFVMGHTQCGAVTAAYQFFKEGHSHHKLHRSVENLVKYIEPCVRAAMEKGGEVIDGAIQENVIRQMYAIREFALSEVDGIKAKDITVYGAVYKIEEDDILSHAVWALPVMKNGVPDKESGVVSISLHPRKGERNIEALIRRWGSKLLAKKRSQHDKVKR